MPVIENISPLHFDHKLGFFGDYENKDDILKLTEVKELSIFQLQAFLIMSLILFQKLFCMEQNTFKLKLNA